jgi:hypothetical protein
MMEKSFCFGLMLGAIGGALIVANSQKARLLLKKRQNEIKQKITEFVDEKAEEVAENVEKVQSKSKKA